MEFKSLDHQLRSKWHLVARRNDDLAKEKMRKEYDTRMRARKCAISVGSSVLIKLNRTDKTTPAWDPVPYTVTHVKGSLVTAQRPNHTMTRNSSFFKLFRHIDDDDDDSKSTSASNASENAPTAEERALLDTQVETTADGQTAAATQGQNEALNVENSDKLVETAPGVSISGEGEETPPAPSDVFQPDMTKRRGRPSAAQAAANAQAKAQQERQRRDTNPPERASARIAGKKLA